MSERSSLDCLLAPQSVAIVGASSDQRRFGGRPIQYLLNAGFDGPIYPINPVRDVIQGLPCHASIDALPGPVDCAMIALGPTDSVKAVSDCAAKGIRSAILFGAGFAELGGEGAALQAEMVAIAKAAGMRLLGPNCMGLLNTNARFYGTFASALEEGIPAPGPIGLVSQSGGYGGYIMKHLFRRGLGLSTWATTGNECDVEAGEVLRWMAKREEVRVIVAYLEGVRDGQTLMEGLELARLNKKPVVVMKVGRSSQGQAAAASHTASLAGEDSVYDAVFQRYGVHRADTSDELIDIAYALARHPQPVGRQVGVISISGGVGVQLADYLHDQRLTLAETPESTKDELRALVPACSPNNPIDMTGLMTTNHELMEKSLDAAFRSNAFDAIIVFLGISGLAPSMATPLREALARAYARHRDKLLIVSVSTSYAEVRAYEDAGCLVFEDPSRATNALGAMAHFSDVAASPAPAKPSLDHVAGLPADITQLDEAAAKAILHKAGVRMPREGVVSDAPAAARLAAEIGFPVALKIVSPDIAHKTEVGGVALGLSDPDAVIRAVEDMATKVTSAAPGARIEGYLVSEMVTGGVETVVGVHRDPAFGPVVTFGLGGVLVELLKDVVIRPAPVDVEEAHRMIGSIRTAPLLTGYRGSPPLAIDALAQTIADISLFAAASPASLRAVEINPLLVREHDVVALDALIQIEPQV